MEKVVEVFVFEAGVACFQDLLRSLRPQLPIDPQSIYHKVLLLRSQTSNDFPTISLFLRHRFSIEGHFRQAQVVREGVRVEGDVVFGLVLGWIFHFFFYICILTSV